MVDVLETKGEKAKIAKDEENPVVLNEDKVEVLPNFIDSNVVALEMLITNIWVQNHLLPYYLKLGEV